MASVMPIQPRGKDEPHEAPLQTSTPLSSPDPSPVKRRADQQQQQQQQDDEHHSFLQRFLGRGGSKKGSLKVARKSSSFDLPRQIVLERVNGELGLTVDRDSNGKVTVSKVTSGGIASVQKILAGDEVLAVNGKPTTAISMEGLVQELGGQTVALVILRPPLVGDDHHNGSSNGNGNTSNGNNGNNGLNTSAHNNGNGRGLDDSTEFTVDASMLSGGPGARRTVQLHRTDSQTFGIEFESSSQKARRHFLRKRSSLASVYVLRVSPDGPASSLVHRGDQIVEVNGRGIDSFSEEKLIKEFRANTDVQLVLVSSSGPDTSGLLYDSAMLEEDDALPQMASSVAATAAAAHRPIAWMSNPASPDKKQQENQQQQQQQEKQQEKPQEQPQQTQTQTPTMRARVWTLPSAALSSNANNANSNTDNNTGSSTTNTATSTTTTNTTSTTTNTNTTNTNTTNTTNSTNRRIITLNKHPTSGFGMKLRTDSRVNGAIVAALSARGVAVQSDVRLGDRLLRINGVDVSNAAHEEIVDLLRASSQVTLEVEPSGLLEDADYIRSVCLATTQPGVFGFTYNVSMEAVPRPALHEDEGQQGHGSETAQAAVIRIAGIGQDGPAERCGHVYVGDCILEVDGCPLLPGTAEKLEQLLQGKTEVNLVLSRQPPLLHDEELDLSLSELEKSQLVAEQALVKRASALGISVLPNPEGGFTPARGASSSALVSAPMDPRKLPAAVGAAVDALAQTAATTASTVTADLHVYTRAGANANGNGNGEIVGNKAIITATNTTTNTGITNNGEAVAPPTISVTFELKEYRCAFGQRVAVVGSLPALGQWDPSRAVLMNWHEGDRWVAVVALPLLAHFEYKFVVVDTQQGNVCVRWEDGRNTRFGGYGSNATLSRRWNDSEGAQAHLFHLLCVAADAGQADRCVELIRQGAAVNGCMRWGTFTRLSHATPLHIAALRKQEAVIETLLAQGADPELRTSLTRLVSDGVREQLDVATALHLAVFEGASKVVQVLVDNGASRSAECFVAQNGAYLSPASWVTAIQLSSLRPHNRASISNLLLSSRI